MTTTSQTAVQTTNGTTKANNLIEYVKRDDLIIDPEFQELFSTGTPEGGYEGLKELIRNDGILDNLKGWKEGMVLLDGHTRVKIYDELKMTTPLPIQWLSFPSKDEAEAWMRKNQVFRRNLNTFRNVENILKLQTFYTAKAKERIRAGKHDPTLTLGEGGEVNEILGKMVKTSADTVRKVKIIKERATPGDIDSLRKNEVTIESVYKKCQGMDKAEKTTEDADKPAKESAEPSAWVKIQVGKVMRPFNDIVGKLSDKDAKGVYICDEIIRRAKEKKAEILRASKKASKEAVEVEATEKGTKEPTKKRAKKGTKKTAKRTKKVAKKATKKGRKKGRKKASKK